MPFRSKQNDAMADDALVDMLTSEEPVVAGRLEWVTTATRDQLADMATRSKTLAGTARTRVTPLTESSMRRLRGSNPQPVVPEPEPSKSSTTWLLIALVASIVSVIVYIAARRARQAEEQVEFDFLVDSDTFPSEQAPLHHHHDYGVDNAFADPT